MKYYTSRPMIKVRSMYRSSWYGVLLKMGERDIVTIMILFDRNGNKMRKPLIKHYHIDWMYILGSKKQPSTRSTMFWPVPVFMQDDEELSLMVARGMGGEDIIFK